MVLWDVGDFLGILWELLWRNENMWKTLARYPRNMIEKCGSFDQHGEERHVEEFRGNSQQT